jgi:hypothetical protein
MKSNSAICAILISLFGMPNLTLAQALDVKPAPVQSGSKSAPPDATQPANANGVPSTPAASHAVNAAIAQPASGAVTQNDVGVADSTQPASTPKADHVSSGSGGTGVQAAAMAPRGIAVSARPAEPISSPRPLKLRYPLSVQLDVMPVWQMSNGYDLFSTNDIATRIGLSAGYDVLDAAPKTPLGVEIGWSTESHGAGVLFRGFNTAFSAHNFHGGLKLRHQVLPFLAPHVSLLAGAARMETSFEVTSVDGVRAFETVKWTPFAMLGVGLAALAPVDNRVAFGASVEAGYSISGSMPLRFDPREANGALPGAHASMGDYGRSGPYLRFGFFVRY